MCDKCAELDEKIARYKVLAERVTDQLTLSGITLLIERCRIIPRNSMAMLSRIRVSPASHRLILRSSTS